MLNWRRPRRTEPSITAQPALTVETGGMLAGNLAALVAGAGCLLGNMAQVGQEIHRALAAGRISEAQASGLIDQLHAAHEHVELACQRVSLVREGIAAPAAEEVHQHA